MTASGTVRDRLLQALDQAGTYDNNAVAAPVALLWPDETRQWESIISEVQAQRRIIRYGEFDADSHQGPAYWLRCVVSGSVELAGAPEGLPIVYLPGVSRSSMRELETIGDGLAPMGAIQHRCEWFTHSNGKDWTIRALFANDQHGLSLDVEGDGATASALLASLPKLMGEQVDRLASKHLDAAFLNGLVNPDPVRSLLQWLSEPSETQASLSDTKWNAFIQQCKDDYGFDPVSDGEIEGARRLGSRDGAWAQAWQRFRESPEDYGGIPDRLRQAQPGELLPQNPGSWPGVSEGQEDELRSALLGLAGSAGEGARKQLQELEAGHKERRGYVWADLGWCPLALALEHLAEMARITSAELTGTTVEEIAAWYSTVGWTADRAVLAALDEVERKPDIPAVSAAITAVYQPWLDRCARALQAAVGPAANSGTYKATPAPDPTPGEVVVFIDGLRLDVAHLLSDRLSGAGLEAHLDAGLAALPTVTQTSKPALVPVDQSLLSSGDGLDACRAPDGPSASVAVLRSMMAEAKVEVLLGSETGDPTGTAWTETGQIDHRGHEAGFALAHEIESEVERISSRIQELLDAGWQKVTIVTDHGWLLLPDGLPKNGDLPVGATETKKGRCARVKDGADVSVPTVPWHWNSDVRIAIAPGVFCFTANQTFEHGGVSPQECVVPRLTVSSGATPTSGASITSLKWLGLALRVEFADLPQGSSLDLRTSPADAQTSIGEVGQLTSGKNKAVLLVADDDLEGCAAYLVLVAADGSLLIQRPTTEGQNS